MAMSGGGRMTDAFASCEGSVMRDACSMRITQYAWRRSYPVCRMATRDAYALRDAQRVRIAYHAEHTHHALPYGMTQYDVEPRCPPPGATSPETLPYRWNRYPTFQTVSTCRGSAGSSSIFRL